MTRPLLILAIVVALGAGAAPGAANADARAGDGRESLRLRAAVRALPGAAETPDGYDRDLFEHWVDADGDCQDTREEVLVAESLVALDGCTITTGRWFSWYDHATWRQASDVDIDHFVPLKEAWDSGAASWSAGTRERFANDLGDRRALVAVTDNVNASKSDQDVAEWLPAYGICRYLRSWVAVKLRWGLAVDPTERAALRRLASHCANRMVVYVRARPAER